MNKAIFSGLILLLLLGFVSSYSAPTFEGQPILIESDSSFYGSDQGQVIIDLNLTQLDISVKDFFVRIIGLDDTNTWVRELRFNKEKIKDKVYPIQDKSKTKLSLVGLEKKPMQIILEFDVNEIDVGREFDIQLVEKDGTIIADLDPFLSGWGFRQEMTGDTTGLISSDTSGNLTLLFPILADNDYWTNEDRDSIRFTDSTEDNVLDHYCSFYSSGDSIAYCWVEITDTFESATDLTMYFYYGNSGASSIENSADAYSTSDVVSAYHFDESSGKLIDYAGSNDATNTDIIYEEPTDVVVSSYGYDGDSSKSKLDSITGFDPDSFSVSMWTKANNNNWNQQMMGSGTSVSNLFRLWFWGLDSSCGYSFRTIIGGNSVQITSNNETLDWVFLTATYNGSQMELYIDGVRTGTGLAQTGNIDFTDTHFGTRYDGVGSFTDGNIDETMIWDRALTLNEIKILQDAYEMDFWTFGEEELGVTNASPDLNITNPTLNLNWNETQSITFNVIDVDLNTTLDVNLFYSTSPEDQTNLIYHDANLSDASGIICSDYNFQDSTPCTYFWDTTGASDGQYYLDGNVSDGTANDLNSSAIFRVDNTDPSTTDSGCGAGWHNVTKTITLGCTDTSGSGCDTTTYRIDGGTWQNYSGTFDLTTDLNHQVDYNSIDNATNVEAINTMYCAIDKTSPSVANPIFVGFAIFGGFINGIGTILGGLATDVLSGIDTATCEYSLNGGGAWISGVWNTDHCEKTNYTIIDGTDYNIGTRVDDNAGNTGTSDFNGIYVGDTTDPVTTDDASNDWSAINETITLSPTDVGGSGVKQTYYCVDEAGACSPNTIGTSVSVECSAGNVCSQYVRYFSEDNVDNNESVNDSVLTRIDKELPIATSIAITDDAGRTEDSTPALTIDSTDASGSGLKEMSFSCNDSTWGSWITYNTSYSSFDVRTGAGCSTDYGTKTIYVRVRDNVDNVSLSTSDSTLLDAPITFGDLNLFLVGDYTQNANLTIDSDHNIEVQVKATSNDLNISSAKWFYQSPFSDANCSGYIRGGIVCGFQEEDEFNLLDQTGTTFTLRSESEDDHAFIPYAYNADPDDYADKSLTSVVLNNSDDWAKTLISNVVVDSNTFYNLSWFGSYTGTGSRELFVYDCNSDVVNPIGNGNCSSNPFTAISSVDDDGYYSIKNISSDVNQIDGINLNADGNHFIYYNCPSCSVAKYWNIGLLDFNSNVDKPRNWTSTSGTGSFTANVKTIDTHYHFIDLEKNNTFTFYFTIDNNQGKTYTSSEYNETISVVNIAPSIDQIVSPTQESYTGNIDMNILVSDPDSDPLVCDFNLVDSSLAFVAVLAEDVSPTGSLCYSDFNSLLYADGNYFISSKVRETDTSELFYDMEFSEEFKIDNVFNQAPTITIIQPNGNEVYETATDTPTIIFTLQDTENDSLSVNLNYSATTGIGSGTQLLLQEDVLTSSSVVCDDSDFSNDTNCSYSWDISGVTDGNYYINMLVTDGNFDVNDVSDGDFNIYTAPAIVSSVAYVERYVSADYAQRDENIYYNPTTAYFLTDGEKQNIYLEQVTLILLVIGAIIVIGVFILWKRKK